MRLNLKLGRKERSQVRSSKGKGIGGVPSIRTRGRTEVRHRLKQRCGGYGTILFGRSSRNCAPSLNSSSVPFPHSISTVQFGAAASAAPFGGSAFRSICLPSLDRNITWSRSGRRCRDLCRRMQILEKKQAPTNEPPFFGASVDVSEGERPECYTSDRTDRQTDRLKTHTLPSRQRSERGEKNGRGADLKFNQIFRRRRRRPLQSL